MRHTGIDEMECRLVAAFSCVIYFQEHGEVAA
jgi:hypothetical protein